MDGLTIDQDFFELGRGGFFAFLIEPGGPEEDVHGLPLARLGGWIHFGWIAFVNMMIAWQKLGSGVNSAHARCVELFFCNSMRVIDLDLIKPLQLDA